MKTLNNVLSLTRGSLQTLNRGMEKANLNLEAYNAVKRKDDTAVMNVAERLFDYWIQSLPYSPETIELGLRVITAQCNEISDFFTGKVAEPRNIKQILVDTYKEDGIDLTPELLAVMVNKS